MSTVSDLLDFSRLPPPEALLPLSFKASFEEAKARLVEVFTAASVPFNVDRLETDSGVLILRVNNWRELLAVAAINRTYLQTLVAYAVSGSLDHIAATQHFLPRMEDEEDDRFRARIQLEAENKAGGRLAGYKAEAMHASIEISNVGAWVDRTNIMEPIVRVALMDGSVGPWVFDGAAPENTTRLKRADGTGSGVPSVDLVAAVQAHLDQEHIKQATDIVAAQAIAPIVSEIAYTIYHRKGADASVLRAASAKSVAAMVDERHVPHRDLPWTAIVAGAAVGGVDKVVMDVPLVDITAGNGQVVFVFLITVRSALSDE